MRKYRPTFAKQIEVSIKHRVCGVCVLCLSLFLSFFFFSFLHFLETGKVNPPPPPSPNGHARILANAEIYGQSLKPVWRISAILRTSFEWSFSSRWFVGFQSYLWQSRAFFLEFITEVLHFAALEQRNSILQEFDHPLNRETDRQTEWERKRVWESDSEGERKKIKQCGKLHNKWPSQCKSFKSNWFGQNSCFESWCIKISELVTLSYQRSPFGFTDNSPKVQDRRKHISPQNDNPYPNPNLT